MNYFSQLDLRWAHIKLGSSKLTIGRWGCTQTAICELARRFGSKITPEEYAHDAAHFTKDGLVIWQAVEKTIPELQFDYREYPAKESNIKAALRDKSRGVLLEVNNGAHWVLATSSTLFGNDYNAIDPLGGKVIQVKNKYKNITKAVYFTCKQLAPTELPKELENLRWRVVIVPEEHGRMYLVTGQGKKVDLGGDAKTIQQRIAKYAQGISLADLAKIPE